VKKMQNEQAGKRSILVVDDTPESIDVLKELLKESYIIRPAPTGEVALKIASATPVPDLILLDIMMPGMDGYEVMRQLQANEATRDIPVIFVTAVSEMEGELIGFRLGAVDYITKPFNPDIVKARVQTHMALREAKVKLEKQNQTLEQRVDDAVCKILEQERMLIRQSRFAAMGEMIGYIGHQWRQPLNVLDLLLTNIQDAYDYKELDRSTLAVAVAKGGKLIRKMSETIDDFRDFFKPNKIKTTFSLGNTVQDTLDILSGSFKSRGIAVRLEVDEDVTVYGYPNELSQVLLNILANAKDALDEKNTAGGEIHIRISDRDGDACVTLRDNAGGIPAEVLPQIFDPYYTTKEKGTGIGLYMSKLIIEDHMIGKLEVRNVEGGTEFAVICPRAEAGGSHAE